MLDLLVLLVEVIAVVLLDAPLVVVDLLDHPIGLRPGEAHGVTALQRQYRIAVLGGFERQASHELLLIVHALPHLPLWALGLLLLLPLEADLGVHVHQLLLEELVEALLCADGEVGELLQMPLLLDSHNRPRLTHHDRLLVLGEVLVAGHVLLARIVILLVNALGEDQPVAGLLGEVAVLPPLHGLVLLYLVNQPRVDELLQSRVFPLVVAWLSDHLVLLL